MSTETRDQRPETGDQGPQPTAKELAFAQELLKAGVGALSPLTWGLKSPEEIWGAASEQNRNGITAVARHVLAKLALADAAISHVLDAICYDPRKYWLMGPLTDSHDKLTAAWAALHGQDAEKAAEQWTVYDRKKYERYCAWLKENERLTELGRQRDTGGAS